MRRLTSFQQTELLSAFPKSKSSTPAERSGRSAKPTPRCGRDLARNIASNLVVTKASGSRL
jgi:hypothetical protein